MVDVEIVFFDGKFIILKSNRIFGYGFNCYKEAAPGSDKFTKINDRGSYFTNFGSAKEFIKSYVER